MIRCAAALVFVLALSPALVSGQDAVFTVTAQTADVHKGPSTVTPVVGHVTRGTVLPVTRNLGSWAKIAWPDAPDGVGYVHVTMGRLTAPNGDAPVPVATISPRTSSTPAASTMTSTAPAPAPPRKSGGERVALRGDVNDTPISHIVGVGGLVGSMSSFGGTARVWRNNRLGIQLGLTRDATTSAAAAGRVTSIQVEPGVVYAPFDHVSDYLWIRPYIGSGLSVRHQTLKVSAAEPASDTGVGIRVFGGGELTFAGVPRFGLSAELGYRRFPTPFPGFEADRLSVSLAGHWYVR